VFDLIHSAEFVYLGSILTSSFWIVCILGVVLVIIYNGHVSRRNAVDYAFGSIDVQLKRRWDLVPQLVETVKGYAAHETELFERVVEVRSMAKQREGTMGERLLYEAELGREIPAVFAVAEAYPELKASKHFMNLQRNLTEIESQVAASRRAYNAAVTEYNDGVEMFPMSVVAGIFGFKRRDWFDMDAKEREVRRVGL